jgi:hypothetical protein
LPAHPESQWSANGAGRGNLFVDADPDVRATDSATRPTATPVTSRRARGLVVAIEETTAAATSATVAQDPAHFTRRQPSALSTARRARKRARAGDRAASEVHTRLVALALPALIAIAATMLLLALAWWGVSMHARAAARGHARRAQQATARTLHAAGDQIRVLTAQRDRAVRLARTARRERATAVERATRWRTQAREANRRLAAARVASRRHRSHR